MKQCDVVVIGAGAAGLMCAAQAGYRGRSVLLLDNAKALVDEHNVQTREVKFNDRFHAFCRYWGVTPRACAPYRARTKGKDERGVGYVKRNAIAGHRFQSIEALQAHLAHWMREVADIRVHGTTGEPPLQRFERAEASALRPLPAKAPFLQVRELTRRVHTDACIELDTNRYSVPWRLIGETVTVVVSERQVRVLYAGQEVASHAQSALRRVSVIERSHLAGIVGAQRLLQVVELHQQRATRLVAGQRHHLQHAVDQFVAAHRPGRAVQAAAAELLGIAALAMRVGHAPVRVAITLVGAPGVAAGVGLLRSPAGLAHGVEQGLALGAQVQAAATLVVFVRGALQPAFVQQQGHQAGDQGDI